MKRFVIRYRYPGTVNGEPVGIVYAENIDHLVPGAWSYRKTPDYATHWTTWADAERERGRHRWPDSEVVEA